MFLGDSEESGHTRSQRFVMDDTTAAVEVLADEEGEDVNKMRMESDFLKCQIVHCGGGQGLAPDGEDRAIVHKSTYGWHGFQGASAA